MKIIDCFMFFNELELLELRLEELYETVDYFVFTEANMTHSGNEKEFIFEQNVDRYKKYLDKIIYIKVTDMPKPSVRSMWAAADHQLNAISRGLDKIATKDDMILLSDLDEIPNTDKIIKYLDMSNWTTEWVTVLKQTLFYYYVNCKVIRNWGGTAIIKYGTFSSCKQIRNAAVRHSYGTTYDYCGWHYSYLTGGDIDKLLYKTENIVDAFCEYRTGGKEGIEHSVAKLKNLYGFHRKLYTMTLVDITDNKPKAMDWFLAKYPQFYRGSL
jgi:beta-1,4-mannosyl-glycoprotein beta-1,4-N-acetylglucosaminyltransferase